LIVNNTGFSISNDSNGSNLSAIIYENDLHLRPAVNPCGKINISFRGTSSSETAILKNSPTRGSPALV